MHRPIHQASSPPAIHVRVIISGIVFFFRLSGIICQCPITQRRTFGDGHVQIHHGNTDRIETRDGVEKLMPPFWTLPCGNVPIKMGQRSPYQPSMEPAADAAFRQVQVRFQSNRYRETGTESRSLINAPGSTNYWVTCAAGAFTNRQQRWLRWRYLHDGHQSNQTKSIFASFTYFFCVSF